MKTMEETLKEYKDIFDTTYTKSFNEYVKKNEELFNNEKKFYILWNGYKIPFSEIEGIKSCLNGYCYIFFKNKFLIKLENNYNGISPRDKMLKDWKEYVSKQNEVSKNVFKALHPKPEVKDSGQRYVNENGGQRDISEGKPNFKYVPFEIIELCTYIETKKYDTLDILEYCYSVLTNKQLLELDLQYIIKNMLTKIGNGEIYYGLESFALFMEKCAKKYSYNNWKLLTTINDKERFKESLVRHCVKVLYGLEDEFHKEAVVFNAMCLLLNKFKEEGENA